MTVATAQPRPLGDVDPRSDQVFARMRDGVRLATDVYLPAGRGPFPAILTRLPYDKTGRDCFIPWVAAYVVEHGFAFVAQDTRGKGRSEGETFAFKHERKDGFDCLDWIVSQPWSDGTVGMWGESYFGFTQWAAAASGHPALCAIVPRNTTAQVSDDWLGRQGVRRLAFPMAWAADTWMDSSMYGVISSDLDWRIDPVDRILSSVHGDRRSASLDSWMVRRFDDELLRELRVVAAAPSRLDIPALHIGGWFDIFQRGQLSDWVAARAAGRATQHLRLDATDHVHATWTERPEGLVDLHGISASEIEDFIPGYMDPSLAFFDSILRKRVDSSEPLVTWRAARGDWRAAESWPLAGSRVLRLFLADGARALLDEEGGALAPKPEGSSSWVRWTDDLGDPVPSLLLDELQCLAAPPDDRTIEARPDVTTFTSEPFPEGIEIAGPAVARLVTSSSTEGSAVTAKLLEVSPDGDTRRLREGAARQTSEADGIVNIELGVLAHRLPPGYRIRLEVSGSAYPQFLPEAGTPDPWRSRPSGLVQRELRIGGSDGSVLELSVLRGDSGE